jgi:hypothetical protein
MVGTPLLELLGRERAQQANSPALLRVGPDPAGQRLLGLLSPSLVTVDPAPHARDNSGAGLDGLKMRDDTLLFAFAPSLVGPMEGSA